MTLSTLPISYCTNVHPGLTTTAVVDGLQQYTVPLAKSVGGHLAAGLWLAAPVIRELTDSRASFERLHQTISDAKIACYTLNAFPYGNFHDARVKEQVYVPDWSAHQRLDYTLNCADILSRLVPDQYDGSISTVPLGFKRLTKADEFESRCIESLLALTRHLAQIEQETGRCIRLAIEPEPLCVLETTPETIAFFEKLFHTARRDQIEDAARRYLGVCYDVCHQAVEFEDVTDSIGDLTRAGIRINKVHITCAIEVNDPAGSDEARQALAQFVEPRYLHQTFARSSTGDIHRCEDLSRELTETPPPEFLNADCWRVHFHVPVNAECVGPLGTTRATLREALRTVAQLDYAPHLEIETYTWAVLPGDEQVELVEGLRREVVATNQLLGELG